MNQDLRQLENEVEAMLATWSDSLDVLPPPGTWECLGVAVRRELNEVWLDDQASPTPDSATLARIRQAVRTELNRVSNGWAGTFRRWRVRLPVAAAAAIVIGMVLLHQAGWPGSRPTSNTADRDSRSYALSVDPLTLFVEAANNVWAGDPLTAAIDTDLESLEEGLGRARTANDGVQDALDDIDERIDDLFESGPIDVLGRLENTQAGAVG
ncbi:MAG TPA: hypothetical protein PKY77_18895 [Phycisphaerae bacterium]|nr:hypothetical protein [Phycisphaerae bacterium]HRY68470.1 hypothetical protein [Phycisphaerae bacterium]HSA28494.1 hypothetical protein [Phycisphaerae bacterium]